MVTATILGGIIRAVNAVANAKRRKAECATTDSERHDSIRPTMADRPTYSLPRSRSTL